MLCVDQDKKALIAVKTPLLLYSDPLWLHHLYSLYAVQHDSKYIYMFGFISVLVMSNKVVVTKKIIIGNTSHPLPRTRDDGNKSF